jgi:hypothetical protein
MLTDFNVLNLELRRTCFVARFANEVGFDMILVGDTLAEVVAWLRESVPPAAELR